MDARYKNLSLKFYCSYCPQIINIHVDKLSTPCIAIEKVEREREQTVIICLRSKKIKAFNKKFQDDIANYIYIKIVIINF